MQLWAMDKAKSPLTVYRETQKKPLTLEAFGKMFEPSVDKSTVLRWERDGIPLNRVVEIEAVTGISRTKLMPDLFEVKRKRKASAEAAE